MNGPNKNIRSAAASFYRVLAEAGAGVAATKSFMLASLCAPASPPDPQSSRNSSNRVYRETGQRYTFYRLTGTKRCRMRAIKRVTEQGPGTTEPR